MGLRGQATTVNPPSTVVTVNGRAGAVVLTPADVGITGGAATRIPVFSSASALAGHAGFTFDPATGIFATPELDLGATPFVFKDTAGVLQLGNVNFTLTYQVPNDNPLLVLGSPTSNEFRLQDGAGNQIDLFCGAGGAISIQDSGGNFFQVDIANANLSSSPVNTFTIGGPGAEWKSGYFGTSVVSPLITATTGNFSGTVTAAAFVTASLQAAFVASPWGVAAGNTGEYRFLELAANGTDYVALKAPDALAAPLTYTLPAVDHVGPWMSNGSGVLSVVAGQDLTIIVPVANKTLTFTKGVLTGVV